MNDPSQPPSRKRGLASVLAAGWLVILCGACSGGDRAGTSDTASAGAAGLGGAVLGGAGLGGAGLGGAGLGGAGLGGAGLGGAGLGGRHELCGVSAICEDGNITGTFSYFCYSFETSCEFGCRGREYNHYPSFPGDMGLDGIERARTALCNGGEGGAVGEGGAGGDSGAGASGSSALGEAGATQAGAEGA
jgi:hypothetical protein